MSKSNYLENAYLLLVFNNTDIAGIGDATGLRGSPTAGSFYLALHTADPGEAGSPATNEMSYGSYARVAIPRTAGGFTVSGNAVSNTAAISFPAATSGSQTATHWSLCTAASGGNIMYKGALSPNIPVATPTVVNIPAGDLDITED